LFPYVIDTNPKKTPVFYPLSIWEFRQSKLLVHENTENKDLMRFCGLGEEYMDYHADTVLPCVSS
jgi:hypothetical protein